NIILFRNLCNGTFRGCKMNFSGLDGDEIPKVKDTLKKIYMLTPPIGIVVALILGYTASMAALLGIALSFIVSFFSKDTRMGIKSVFNSLVVGAKGTVLVAIATSSAGIIVGVSSYTGLGFKFTSFVTSLSGGNIWLAGILVMV